MKYFLFNCILFFILLAGNDIWAQDRLYHNEFPLQDVTLLDGPFKHARDLNIQTLLKYDVDRLLAPFRKEAGLPPKASFYPNWEGLDGHIGGHYLTAMAMNYSATQNSECKKRMDYMISELKACQEANEINNAEWGKGYIGGVPKSKTIWSTLQKGDFTAYRATWAPWYNLHKLYAGLRDAWIYTGNKDARTVFLKFCDWGINITSSLTDEQMQSMLDSEQGGMNEIFADAYQISGDEKYLTTAKRFSHRMLLDAMAADDDNLDNKHANTQIPKAIGFQRIAELSHDKNFKEAGSFFWETVTGKRSLAFGGNSRKEFFPGASSCIDFINDVEGPESCNSYNMLKLTEDLFRTNPSAKYADYYERTLYNHILSTQHPEHGGYVYFTPARPRHYRVYSAPNEAMWCCVGTGMENHGKYNQFIYTHKDDSLYLNLFIASELNWQEKGIKIMQETIFPDEEKTKLTVTKGASHFCLMIRYPSWVEDNSLKIIVNGKTVSYKSHQSSYIAVDRLWKKGDVVQILLPMHNSIEHLPNVPSYIAIMHGPILLGAKTGTEDLKGLVADDGRWSQIAGGQKLPIDKAPIIIEDDISKITDKLVSVDDKPLTFTIPGVKMINPVNVVLEPFFRIHDARYMMYWKSLTNSQSGSYLDSLAIQEKEVSAQTTSEGKKISSDLFGLFFEDINYSADGGLYAELVQNRSFEYSPTDRPEWNPFSFWEYITPGFSYGSISVETKNPVHPNNPHYVVLNIEHVSDGGGVGIKNYGFDGMVIRVGDKYNLSLFVSQLTPEPVSISVSLQNRKGKRIAESSFSTSARDWKKYTASLIPTESNDSATLVIMATTRGKLALDVISLFPEKTFRNRPNGMRADLAQVLADIKPKFIRFPGGCLSHGDGLGNMYRWKNTIGPIEERVEQKNIWNYHQTVGLGYFEYFQFCEDIGAKPVPILPAGVSCQNSGGTWRIGGTGQKAIPMNEMPEYIQEVLDLIEWANGPATSTWGAKRAAAGHADPFNLQYIGIGNEDKITPEFEERFKMIYNAVKALHPEITVIGTVGPGQDGDDFTKGWKFANQLNLPVVDEHYYCAPKWFLENLHRYDTYTRNATKVYLGEYASWGNKMSNAVTEAVYLISLERNGDVVKMASYAPLLAKKGFTQWQTDLIYFDNVKICPSVNYYVQKMFSTNQGDLYFDKIISKEVKDSTLAASCIKDSRTGDIILKFANIGNQSKNLKINLSDFKNITPEAEKTVLTGNADAENTFENSTIAIPQISTYKVSPKFEYTVPAMSLTVLRVKNKSN